MRCSMNFSLEALFYFETRHGKRCYTERIQETIAILCLEIVRP